MASKESLPSFSLSLAQLLTSDFVLLLILAHPPPAFNSHSPLVQHTEGPPHTSTALRVSRSSRTSQLEAPPPSSSDLTVAHAKQKF